MHWQHQPTDGNQPEKAYESREGNIHIQLLERILPTHTRNVWNEDFSKEAAPLRTQDFEKNNKPTKIWHRLLVFGNIWNLLWCIFISVLHEKYHCRWKRTREGIGPSLTPVEAASRAAKYWVFNVLLETNPFNNFIVNHNTHTHTNPFNNLCHLFL